MTARAREAREGAAVKPLTRPELYGFLARLWLDYKAQQERPANDGEAECHRSQESA